MNGRARNLVSTCLTPRVILAFVTALSIGLASTNVYSGPPTRSSGHGGFNWNAAANQILQGVQQARSVRQHSSPSYRQQQHYTPRYSTPSYPQTRRYNTIPHYNITPRYTQPSHNTPIYRAPARRNSTPAPRTIVRPHTNSMPRSNVARATNVVPRTNSVPTRTLTPRANSVPSSTVARVAPPQNTMPPMNRATGAATANRAAANPADAVPADTVPNGTIADIVADMTQEDIDDIVSQLDERDLTQLAEVRQMPLIGLDDSIDDLPNAADLTPADRQRLREAIDRGDPDAVRELLGPDDEASDAGRDLIDRAAAIQLIDDIAAGIVDGTLNGPDVAALVDGAQLFPPGDQAAALDVFGQIAADQQLVIWLLDTQPGVGDVPFGPDVPIALIPGLPQGLLMPLDGGPVMVGMGAPGDAILLGTGNPWEVAGMPVALPGAEPAPEVEADYADGTAVIANAAGSTVNYNVDNQPFSLETDYEQTLNGGSSWVVEFDRGGGNGTAAYTLSPGHYKFKATESGWDLYRSRFQSSLDNSENTFPFHYILDNQQQTLAPGEVHDLSGDFPPVITFDNGRGQEKKVRLDSGTYRVAVGPDQAFDIYAENSVSRPTPQSIAKPGPYLARSAAAPMSEPADRPTSAKSQTASYAPKAQTTSTRSVPAAKRQEGVSLPAGFKLFDPVEALTDPGQARLLPRDFTLFRSAAETMAQSENQN